MRYFATGAAEPPADIGYEVKAQLALREREVRSQEYMTWIELAKFAALLAIPVGAILGVAPITKAIKKAVTG